MSVSLKTFEEYREYYKDKPNGFSKWLDIEKDIKKLINKDQLELALKVAGLFAASENAPHVYYQDDAYAEISIEYIRKNDIKMGIDVALRSHLENSKSNIFMRIINRLLNQDSVDDAVTVLENYGEYLDDEDTVQVKCNIATIFLNDPLKREQAIKIFKETDLHYKGYGFDVFERVIERYMQEQNPISALFYAKLFVSKVDKLPNHKKRVSKALIPVIEYLYKEKRYNEANELRDLIPDKNVKTDIFKEEDFPTAPPPPFPKLS